MNKLSKEHLYLLLDEPIYVLHEHNISPELKPTEVAIAKLDEPETSTEEYANTESPQLAEFKGENKKGILIINNIDGANIISAEDEEFLFKGLNKLGFTLADVAIINPTATGDYSKLPRSKQIIFSSNPTEEGLYQIEMKDGISCLQCQRLNHIQQNQDMKIKFWLGLKALFGK